MCPRNHESCNTASTIYELCRHVFIGTDFSAPELSGKQYLENSMEFRSCVNCRHVKQLSNGSCGMLECRQSPPDFKNGHPAVKKSGCCDQFTPGDTKAACKFCKYLMPFLNIGKILGVCTALPPVSGVENFKNPDRWVAVGAEELLEDPLVDLLPTLFPAIPRISRSFACRYFEDRHAGNPNY